MKAHVQITSGVIRLWEKDEDAWGKPYDLCASFASTDNETAYILGFTSGGKLTTAHAREAARALKEATGLKIKWFRYRKDGKKVTK